MTVYRSAVVPTLVLALLAAAAAASAQSTSSSAASAATSKAPKKDAKAAKPKTAKTRKPAAKPEAKPPEPVALPAASPEQISAAEKVYYGGYACEFNQHIDIAADTRNFGYVELKLAKESWIMKPVVSSTGAIRLEDVTGETLMVQISSKSMLLNVRTGHRIVDDCVSAKQRQLIEAARAAKAAEAASGAEAASAPK
jgi:hypothetical protein